MVVLPTGQSCQLVAGDGYHQPYRVVLNEGGYLGRQCQELPDVGIVGQDLADVVEAPLSSIVIDPLGVGQEKDALRTVGRGCYVDGAVVGRAPDSMMFAFDVHARPDCDVPTVILPHHLCARPVAKHYGNTLRPLRPVLGEDGDVFRLTGVDRAAEVLDGLVDAVRSRSGHFVGRAR